MGEQPAGNVNGRSPSREHYLTIAIYKISWNDTFDNHDQYSISKNKDGVGHTFAKVVVKNEQLDTNINQVEKISTISAEL